MKIKPNQTIHLNSISTLPAVSESDVDAIGLKTAKYLKEIDQLQYLMYSECKHSLLIILQGVDAAGKDGTIRHIFSGLSPLGCSVSAFKEPTHLELKHDFLWRAHRVVPEKGSIVIFNRSHYEDVLITKVHGLINKKESARRYDHINHFEKLLSEENDTHVLKFFLHISKEEQLKRLKKRIEDPNRHWKISESDFTEREHWKGYQKAYESLLPKTSTALAPWFIIPSDRKWYRNYLISKTIHETLSGLKMRYPLPTVNINKLKKKYLD